MVLSTLGSGEIYFEVEGLESIMRGSFTAMSPKSYYGIFFELPFIIVPCAHPMGGKGGKGPGVGGGGSVVLRSCSQLTLGHQFHGQPHPHHQQPSIIESLMHTTWWCHSDYKMETK